MGFDSDCNVFPMQMYGRHPGLVFSSARLFLDTRRILYRIGHSAADIVCASSFLNLCQLRPFLFFVGMLLAVIGL